MGQFGLSAFPSLTNEGVVPTATSRVAARYLQEGVGTNVPVASASMIADIASCNVDSFETPNSASSLLLPPFRGIAGGAPVGFLTAGRIPLASIVGTTAGPTYPTMSSANVLATQWTSRVPMTYFVPIHLGTNEEGPIVGYGLPLGPATALRLQAPTGGAAVPAIDGSVSYKLSPASITLTALAIGQTAQTNLGSGSVQYVQPGYVLKAGTNNAFLDGTGLGGNVWCAQACSVANDADVATPTAIIPFIPGLTAVAACAVANCVDAFSFDIVLAKPQYDKQDIA